MEAARWGLDSLALEPRRLVDEISVLDSTSLGCSFPLPFPGAAAIGLVAVLARRRGTPNPGPRAMS